MTDINTKLAAALTRFEKEPEARRFAIIGLAERIAARLDSKNLPPINDIFQSWPDDLGSREAKTYATELRAWRDDPEVDELAKLSSLLPIDLAEKVAQGIVDVAVQRPELQPLLLDALNDLVQKPVQSLKSEMSSYLGISLMMFIAKFGFENGAFVMHPWDGETFVNILKQIANIVGHTL
jgi:hypothetical protein